jgi:hypothetical protein
MDEQIIRDLFSNTIQAAEVLSLDEGLRQQLAAARARLAPNQVGKNGQLQEWMDDWDARAPEQQHRHISHMYVSTQARKSLRAGRLSSPPPRALPSTSAATSRRAGPLPGASTAGPASRTGTAPTAS